MTPGLPVALGDIDRQLGLLWEHSDTGKVRASLVNLVIYSESPDAIAENTPLLSEIAAGHAFRPFLCRPTHTQKNPACEHGSPRIAICALRGSGRSAPSR